MPIISAIDNNLIDHTGIYWLDLQSGILNTPFGHNSEAIKVALSEILRHGLVNTYDRVSENQVEFLNLMEFYAPGYTWKPFNTGAEAIEKAIEVAATHFGRLPKIAVLKNSFHGKMLSMAWANFGDKLPWGNPLNIVSIDLSPESPDGQREPDFDVLIYEPIQGHDGTVNREEVLRVMCNQRGALLIADEMITGFMRCGKRFMSKTADIIVSGKGVSAGVPLSLLGFKPAILHEHNGTIPVGWRTTGAGNNLAMTVGLASLRILIDMEDDLRNMIVTIEDSLTSMGFNATGALGFKDLKNQPATKSFFESQRLIASFHCPPKVRVGPSFITSEFELGKLRDALEAIDEL